MRYSCPWASLCLRRPCEEAVRRSRPRRIHQWGPGPFRREIPRMHQWSCYQHCYYYLWALYLRRNSWSTSRSVHPPCGLPRQWFLLWSCLLGFFILIIVVVGAREYEDRFSGTFNVFYYPSLLRFAVFARFNLRRIIFQFGARDER